MSYTNNFTVPKYYKNFSCKGKDCRHSCCKGWDVTISMNEYFKLSSLSCSKNLRKKLDKSFILTKNPTKDRYAKVAKTYDLDCPLHMENGYCQLHSECGEKILPLICQYYP